ncbi:MAG TPA: CDP-diacylglycerol--serine O-phosphatidyltransferase [Spirochaetota bacterium]
MNVAWIPNSITMGNLLFGFLSIIFSSQGHYQLAGFAILFAALLDGLDGQVARMLKVSSPLGAELDSLADCVTFGVAPGYLAFAAFLPDMAVTISGRVIELNMFVAAVYPLCAAYRLARFNMDHSPDSFSGLPSPIAGIIMALVPIAFIDPESIREHPWIFVPIYVFLGLLMVSTVRFSKPQSYILSKIHGIKLVILALIIVVLSVIFHKYILLVFIGLIGLYIVSGLISFVIQFIQDHKY